MALQNGVTGGSGGKMALQNGVTGGSGVKMALQNGVNGSSGVKMALQNGVTGGSGGKMALQNGVTGGSGVKMALQNGVNGSSGVKMALQNGVTGGSGVKMALQNGVTGGSGVKMALQNGVTGGSGVKMALQNGVTGGSGVKMALQNGVNGSSGVKMALQNGVNGSSGVKMALQNGVTGGSGVKMALQNGVTGGSGVKMALQNGVTGGSGVKMALQNGVTGGSGVKMALQNGVNGSSGVKMALQNGVTGGSGVKMALQNGVNGSSGVKMALQNGVTGGSGVKMALQNGVNGSSGVKMALQNGVTGGSGVKMALQNGVNGSSGVKMALQNGVTGGSGVKMALQNGVTGGSGVKMALQNGVNGSSGVKMALQNGVTGGSGVKMALQNGVTGGRGVKMALQNGVTGGSGVNMALQNGATGVKGAILTAENVNQRFKNVAHVTHGKHGVRAKEIDNDIQHGVKCPFTTMIKANTGDCQAMGQRPITFIREVLALVIYPDLASDPRFASDVRERARNILNACEGGSAGAYTDKQGLECVRRNAAEFITKRDGGIPADYRNITLTSGSCEAIKLAMKLVDQVVDGMPPGVLCPIPQYPLYSGNASALGMTHIGYYLDEDKAWGFDIKELQRVVDDARTLCNPRILVITNPGNPAGQVLSRSNMEQVIRFAHKERLFILADEVYQVNVYDKDSEFHSFRRVMLDMGPPYSTMELASFMLTSKGFTAECGVRGGYVEMLNLRPDVMALLKNFVSIASSPNIAGQVALDCMVNPPQPGDPSYEQFHEEKTAILNSLAERAKITADAFNRLEGVTCNIVQGAMYAFPKISMPEKALAQAAAEGESPDSFYAIKLVEQTGVWITPGYGYRQKPGTWHLRVTILPQLEELKVMMKRIEQFHKQFLIDYK